MLAGQLGGSADTPYRRYVLGRLAYLSGRKQDAYVLLRGGWEQLDAASDPVLAVKTAATLANLHVMRVEPDAAAKWARRALDVAPDEPTRDDARYTLMLALAVYGRADAAIRLGYDAEATTSGRGMGPLTSLACASVLLWSDQLADARERFLTAADHFRRRGPLAFAVVALGLLGDTEYRLGAWDDAIAHGILAASMADDAGQMWLIPYCHSTVAYPLAGRGQWADAERHIAVAVPTAKQVGDPSALQYSSTAAGLLAAARGQPREVVVAIESMPALARTGTREPGVSPWPAILADAYVTLGRLDEADAVLRSFEELALACSRRSALAASARIRGRIAATRGEHQQAETAFRAALAQADELSMPFEQACTALTYGSFLRRLGHRSAGAQHLTAARDILERLGARPYVERCRQELAACGLSTSRADVLPTELTPQELAVARLAAAGRTNREVAEELVISVKTVEYHLTKVFTKLGVRSRSTLAADFPRRHHSA